MRSTCHAPRARARRCTRRARGSPAATSLRLRAARRWAACPWRRSGRGQRWWGMPWGISFDEVDGTRRRRALKHPPDPRAPREAERLRAGLTPGRGVLAPCGCGGVAGLDGGRVSCGATVCGCPAVGVCACVCGRYGARVSRGWRVGRCAACGCVQLSWVRAWVRTRGACPVVLSPCVRRAAGACSGRSRACGWLRLFTL